MNTSWSWLLAGLSLLLAFDLGKCLHLSLAAIYLWVVGSAIYTQEPGAIFTAFILTLLAAAFTYLAERHEDKVKWAIALTGIVSTFVTLAQLPLVPYMRMGLSNYASMNGCLIAFTIPFALLQLNRRPYLSLVYCSLAIVALFATAASVPVGVIAIMFVAACVVVKKKIPNSLIVALAFIPVLFLCAGYWLSPDVFFSSSGRFIGWRMIFSWWVSSGKILFGLGTGASNVVFGLQHATNDDFKHMALWAHNDYLQLAFDNGLVGLGLGLAVLYYALKAALDRPWLFSSIVGYAATAFFNMPVHMPLQAFVGTALLWLAHVGRR